LSYELVGTFAGHTNAALSVDFSPDGKMAVSGGNDGTVIVWDTDFESSSFGQPVREYQGHSGGANDIAFLPDGHSALSASFDGTLIQWRIDTLDELLAWIHENRPIRTLTCAERARYGVEPLCES
jgi:WD40 repeat protein